MDRRHGTKPMSMTKLREWYEKMLDSATQDGVVQSYVNIMVRAMHAPFWFSRTLTSLT